MKLPIVTWVQGFHGLIEQRAVRTLSLRELRGSVIVGHTARGLVSANVIVSVGHSVAFLKMHWKTVDDFSTVCVNKQK